MIAIKRTRKELNATAHHEAGHAVIARVLTLPTGHASIKPNYRVGRAGHVVNVEPYACMSEWGKRGKVRETNAIWHAKIIMLMAGAESEKALLGSPALGDGDDRYQILLLAEELVGNANWAAKLEPRLRAMTRMLVRRHRVLIKRVAKALLASPSLSLSGKTLDKIVGRSVDDVTVNAPILLEMHRQHRAAERKAKRSAAANAKARGHVHGR
jgi:hypothetical protein